MSCWSGSVFSLRWHRNQRGGVRGRTPHAPAGPGRAARGVGPTSVAPLRERGGGVSPVRAQSEPGRQERPPPIGGRRGPLDGGSPLWPGSSPTGRGRNPRPVPRAPGMIREPAYRQAGWSGAWESSAMLRRRAATGARCGVPPAPVVASSTVGCGGNAAEGAQRKAAQTHSGWNSSGRGGMSSRMSRTRPPPGMRLMRHRPPDLPVSWRRRTTTAMVGVKAARM